MNSRPSSKGLLNRFFLLRDPGFGWAFQHAVTTESGIRVPAPWVRAVFPEFDQTPFCPFAEFYVDRARHPIRTMLARRPSALAFHALKITGLVLLVLAALCVGGWPLIFLIRWIARKSGLILGIDSFPPNPEALFLSKRADRVVDLLYAPITDREALLAIIAPRWSGRHILTDKRWWPALYILPLFVYYLSGAEGVLTFSVIWTLLIANIDLTGELCRGSSTYRESDNLKTGPRPFAFGPLAVERFGFLKGYQYIFVRAWRRLKRRFLLDCVVLGVVVWFIGSFIGVIYLLTMEVLSPGVLLAVPALVFVVARSPLMDLAGRIERLRAEDQLARLQARIRMRRRHSRNTLVELTG